MHSKIFEIGKHVVRLASPIVGARRVHALVAPPDTPLPHLVYQRVETTRYDDGDKDAGLMWRATLELNVYSNSYPDGVSQASKLADALCSDPALGCELVGASEDVTEDGLAYLQVLTFECTIWPQRNKS